jgi:hypothetical protein
MKTKRKSFINNLRFLCLVGIIALGLMTIVGSGGGGGGGGGGVTAPTSGGGGDSGDGTAIGEDIDTSWVTFFVNNAKSLIATENVASQSSRRVARQDRRTIPTYVFRTPATEQEAKARSAAAESEDDQDIGCNLISIDEDGVASDAFESLEELNVMYTVLSKDQKTVYVVLDPDYMHSAQNTVSSTNCMMFAVDLQTNEYTCLDQGYAPQKMDNDFRQTISNSTAKPIQMDDEGNIYYLGRPFTPQGHMECVEWDNSGNCVSETMMYDHIEFDWQAQPVIRKICVQKDPDGNLMYDEEGHLLYEEPESLTPDNNYIDSFLVSKGGIVVYTYFNQESGQGGIKMYADGATNALTGDDTSGWWGDMFYVIGDGGTVIYGSGSSGWGSGGVKFAQKHPAVAGARVVCQLDTSLFTARNNSPTPSRIMMGDDGYIYGLFNENTGYWDEATGTQVEQARINLFRILPYKQTPIISIEVTGNWWDAMRGFDVQISKGYAYYVQTDKHPQNLYSARDVIKITKLATGDTTTLLNGSSESGDYALWDDRYELYSWKLVGSKIHFSGFDSNATQVVTGEIDITKLRQGKPATGDDGYLTITAAASALGESARIRDMEVLRPEVVYDSVGAPIITKIYTDPENLYSVSIDFSKYMNRSDVNGKTSIKAVATDEEIAYAMKVWLYRTLHMILDTDASNAATDPLEPDTMYEVSVDGSAYDLADEWQLDMADSPNLSKTFTTVPDNGWYQSTAIALEDYSDGSVGKYVRAENTDTGLDFYRLLGTKADDGTWTGTNATNFKLELSVQYLGDSWNSWNALVIRLNDAQKKDWESVDWSVQTITDSQGYTWEWRDGYRMDADGNKYSWCNYEHCEKPIELSTGTSPGWIDGIYSWDTGYIYIRQEGCDVDVDGNTYYWYWDDDTQQGGYQKYDSYGKSGGNLLATIIWVEGYYTNENGINYIWSFGEYRNENDSADIIDWDSGMTYTWTSGYHMNKDTGEVVEIPYLEWTSGKYVATYDANGDPIAFGDEISENSWWNWTETMGAYYQLNPDGTDTGESQTWWDDTWISQADANWVENTKKDNWEARLFRIECDASGRISGDYRWGDWDQSWFEVMSTSNEETKREWRKVIVSVYGSNLDISVLDGEGNVITSDIKTDYDNTPGDGSGTYFLDLNVNSNLVMDNIVVTELNSDGTAAGGDALFEETFSSATLSSTWSDPGQYTSEW